MSVLIIGKKNGKTINLSILDFKSENLFVVKAVSSSINLSILDFKYA